MSQNVSRTARVEARIAPDALAVIKRAAEVQGRSISDFMVAAAHEAARRTVEEEQIVRLSTEDQARFVEALLDPSEPSFALKRAKKAHRDLIAESR